MNRPFPGPPAEPSSVVHNDMPDTQSVESTASAQIDGKFAESSRQALSQRPRGVHDDRPSRVVTETGAAHQRIVEIAIGRGHPSETALKTFEADQLTIQSLRHPRVLPIQSVDRADDRLTIVMKQGPETSLESQLTDSFQPWLGVCETLQSVAETLSVLHSARIAHGGLRPCRILIGPEGPLLTDVSLALVEGTALSGRPEPDEACLSPEQWGGQRCPLTPAMDVYSIGAILYRMLCGRYPFRTDSRMELLRQVLEDPPQPPRQLAHMIPQRLEKLCLSCLSRDPESRPSSATAVASELAEILADPSDGDSYDSSTGGLSSLQPANATRAQPEADARLLVIEVAAMNAGDRSATVPSNTITALLEIEGARRVESSASTLVYQLPHQAVEDNWINWFANAAHRVLTLLTGQLRESSDDTALVRIQLSSAMQKPAVGHSDVETLPLAFTEFVCRVDATANARFLSMPRGSLQFLNRGLARAVAAPTNGRTVLVADDGTVLTTRLHSARDMPALVGRRAQAAMLQTRWEQTCEGMGQVVLVMGDEGTGKSRLIQELVDSTSPHSETSAPIIWTCRPPQHGRAFHPVLEWLRQQSGSSPTEALERQLDALTQVLEKHEFGPAEARELLATELGLAQPSSHETPLTENQRREKIAAYLLEWLSGATNQRPRLFVVEDLQWVDAATLSFLEQLVDRGSNNRLLTILSCRSEFESPWGSRAHQTQVALNRLTTRHVRELVTAISGRSPDPDEIAGIKEQTNGIPLLVEHHARYRLAK